jgi:allantoicase
MQSSADEGRANVSFANLIDLAAEGVGGRVLWANDEFFAEKENLLKPGRGVFIAGKFTERGKWMDGWETRRRRTPGHDSAVLKLGLPGVVRGVNVDTNHFVGNFPEYCSVEGYEGDDAPPFDQAPADGRTWTEVVPRTKLQGGSQNFIPVASDRRFTHLRLHIYPDGGVARLRVHGEVRPDVARLRQQGQVDLAAAEHGGVVVQANDSFFGPRDNLILPGRAANMGEGWETRRKRVPGFDWIVVKLAAPGVIEKVEVDTNHFKGNYPDTCSLEGVALESPLLDFANAQDLPWKELLPRTKLQASTQHFYEAELREKGPFSHVRLNIFPDGGVSRLRLYGKPL